MTQESQDARGAVTAATLFSTFFLPLYPADVRHDLAAARQADANPAKNPGVLRHLAEAADVFTQMAPSLFGNDGASLGLDYSDASIHRLSRALTRTRRDTWASKGAAGTPESELFNLVVHGAAYVGACVVKNHGGTWSVRRPLWESLVALSSRAGDAELAVFHWWLKSLADATDHDDGDVPLTATTLADRYRTHVEIPRAPVDDLPVVIAGGARKLPRLSKIRYDVLYKYLKANLPEIRDVGEHFPSPARFDELAFKWLDFHVVGDGRMVLLVGFTSHGVHLFWLGANGFEKAALYPCDGFPEPVVRITGDKIQLLVSYEEKTLTHEMLWWGP